MAVDAEGGASAEGGVAGTSMLAPETTEGVPQVSFLGERALTSVPPSVRFFLPVLLLSRYQCLPAPLRVYALNASPPLPPQLVFPHDEPTLTGCKLNLIR